MPQGSKQGDSSGLVAGGADPAAIESSRRKAETGSHLVARFLSDHVQLKRKARTAHQDTVD